MMKRAFLVITHGDMGIEAVKSMELLMGPQDNVKALGLHPGESVEDLRTKAFAVLEENEREYDETVLVVDLLGGSPSNVSLSTLAKYHEQNFSEAEDNTDKLIRDSIEVATEGMQLIDKTFLQHQN